MSVKPRSADVRIVDAFNERYPVGTPVYFWPGIRGDKPLGSVTRTPAQLLSGHTPVVWVKDYSGCIALTHVDPIEVDAA